ncbi:MAG: carboxypeptidase-like regulatory domain-containing protein [Bacteroidota bacterium]
MQRFVFIIFVLGTNSLVLGQTLEGKVYDSKAVVKNIKVLNKTQKRLTVTDKDGNFSIPAKINDTISFQSVFYHPKDIIVTQTHFDDLNVFEVKKIVSELDEVTIKADPEQPVFEEETYNEELQNLIQEDIKRNPQLYQPPGATYGVDFIYLIGQVAKLFKRKRPKVPTYKLLTYTQIDSLFKKSTFFNERLVTEDLNIPEDKTKLFFDFCEAKGISSELLQDGKKMMLLEQLVLNSQLFLLLLEEYGEQKKTKD